MVKFGVFVALVGICAAVAFTALSSSPAQAAGDCKRTKFETKMVKEACAKGGQKAAKDAMKVFLKEVKAKKHPKIKGCPSCHTKTSGDYPLKKNGMELFKDAGGEVLEETPAR